jgi:hypothetical protein
MNFTYSGHGDAGGRKREREEDYLAWKVWMSSLV